MNRKFYTLEPGEEFIGILRPSLWTLVPRALASLVLIIFPFVFWPALLHFGIFLGGAIGAGVFAVGLFALRDIRRFYLENGLSITSERVIDVYAKRRSFKVTELSWKNIDKILVERSGFFGMIGYGSLLLKGVDDVGYSLIVRPLWKPDLVRLSLPRV